MSRPPVKSMADVMALFDAQFGVGPYAKCDGPNNSVLMFYAINGVNFIIQVFPHAGWEVFGASPGNRIEPALQWVRQLAGLPDEDI